MNYAFRLPFKHPFSGAFSRPGFGQPIPPVSEDLLVWLTGTNSDTQKLDRWKKPDAENFTMSGGACVSLNGVDEFGTLDSPITLVGDFEASFTVVPDLLKYQGPFNLVGDKGLILKFRNNGDIWIRLNNVAAFEEFIVVGAYTTLDIQRFHIIIVGNQLDLYRNGVNILSTIIVNPPSGDLVGTIGAELSTFEYFKGKLYNLRLKDATKDISFRCQENSGLTSFSDDYENDGHYITWDAIEANLWAQKQDTYFANATLGWWEIDTDPVLYPYPVVGFTTFHKGGTFNNCEVSYAPESFPVGTFNGVDDNVVLDSLPIPATDITSISFYTEILYDAAVYFRQEGSSTNYFLLLNGNAFGQDNSGTPTYSIDGVVVTDPSSYVGDGIWHLVEITGLDLSSWTGDLQISGYPGFALEGIIRDVNINGTLIPINEGEGTDIHDSEGNVIGFADVTIPTFWEGEPMVAQSIIEAELVQGSTVFTDGSGHPTPNTQQEWEASLIINNNKQYYLTNCNGLPNLLIYNRVLTTAEDVEVKVFGCL